MNKIQHWFLARWPGRWRLVAGQYAELGALRFVLADIAQRGAIHSSHFIAGEREAAFAEGRRALALEIIELAGIDPDRLRMLIETPIERTRK